jgi:phenylacetate-CoA ligase
MPEFLYQTHWRLSKARECPGIHERVRQLGEEARLTPEAWHERCRKRLQAVLTFAQGNVPYYRGAFKRAGFNVGRADSTADSARIPILTKDLIRKCLRDLVAERADRTRMIPNATGGSTGTPVDFYQDLDVKAISDAIDVDVRRWWGIKPYDRTALVWGADREFHTLSWKERFYHWRMRTRSLNAFRMTEQSLLEFCRMLTRWRPPYLMGYASALEALARCSIRHHVDGLRFRAIRSAAETLWPAQRQLIEEAFQSPVYNFYGSREIPSLAAECPEEKRLHLISTWRYVETTDEQGRPLPPGETGYIVVTDLSNYTMPFIRYRNDDMGRLAKDLCPCGRPSPVLEKLLGRSSDLIRTPQGDIVHGEFFTHLFYGRSDIRQFQVHQTALDRLTVRYVPVGEPPNAFIRELSEKIRARLGSDVTVVMEACEQIPVPPSGKHRFTISDVKPVAAEERFTAGTSP